MASGGGISGVAVAVAAVGGVLAYAGYRGVGPIEALRDISSGDPAGIESKTAGLGEGRGVGGVAGHGGASASNIVRAAMAYKNDQYSQPLRHKAGYSDCSSFVSKAYKDVGIDPPTPDITTGYMSSPRWTTISKSKARAGDIAVNSQHMVLVTGPGRGIGQQNSRDDVKSGSLSDLMANSGSWVVRRYTGPLSKGAGGQAGRPGRGTIPGTGSGV